MAYVGIWRIMPNFFLKEVSRRRSGGIDEEDELAFGRV